MIHWKVVGVVIDGEPISVGGINPWKFEWTEVQKDPIELPHPAYPNQRHRMWIYDVQSDGRTIRFAAGELSANVWGFYVPATQSPLDENS